MSQPLGFSAAPVLKSGPVIRAFPESQSIFKVDVIRKAGREKRIDRKDREKERKEKEN